MVGELCPLVTNIFAFFNNVFKKPEGIDNFGLRVEGNL